MDSKLNLEERDAKHFSLTGELFDLRRPIIDKEEATELASLLFGLRVSDQLQVREFDSYDDRNYYMKGTLTYRPANENIDGALLQENEDEFVLKILNNLDSENLLYVNAQNEMMLYLNARGFNCPVPMQSLKGPHTLLYKSKSSEEKMRNKEISYREHAVRLLSFVPGKLIKCVSCTTDLLFDLGRYVSKIHTALQVRRKCILRNESNRKSVFCVAAKLAFEKVKNLPLRKLQVLILRNRLRTFAWGDIELVCMRTLARAIFDHLLQLTFLYG